MKKKGRRGDENENVIFTIRTTIVLYIGDIEYNELSYIIND